MIAGGARPASAVPPAPPVPPLRRQRRPDAEKPGHHPLDIAIDDHGGKVEGNRRDCRRLYRARPPAGRAKAVRLAGHPRCLFGHRTRTGQKIARPRVIAKARPFGHHRAIFPAGASAATLGHRLVKRLNSPSQWRPSSVAASLPTARPGRDRARPPPFAPQGPRARADRAPRHHTSSATDGPALRHELFIPFPRRPCAAALARPCQQR